MYLFVLFACFLGQNSASLVIYKNMEGACNEAILAIICTSSKDQTLKLSLRSQYN